MLKTTGTSDHHAPPTAVLLERIRGEYLEMPGLRLTLRQACRLWQLDQATCEAVLSKLLEERFLVTSGSNYLARPPDA
jgi:hypothetical protein